MNNDTIVEFSSSGIDSKTYWEYKVSRRGEDLVFSFDSRPYVRKIRHHTSEDYYPYADIGLSKGDELVIAPGQWLHGLVDGVWSRLTDADNR